MLRSPRTHSLGRPEAFHFPPTFHIHDLKLTSLLLLFQNRPYLESIQKAQHSVQLGFLEMTFLGMEIPK